MISERKNVKISYGGNTYHENFLQNSKNLGYNLKKIITRGRLGRT